MYSTSRSPSLVTPQSTQLSGGNLYNQHVFGEWQRLTLQQAQLQSSASLLVDSLYIEDAPLNLSVPYVALCHYLPSENPLLSMKSQTTTAKKEKSFFENATGIVCTGQGLSNRLREQFQAVPVRTCTPGTNMRAETRVQRKDSTSPVSLLSVGPICEAKGLLEAIHWIVRSDLENWTWTHIGLIHSPQYLDHIHTYIQSSRKSHAFEFIDHVPPENMGGYYQQADAFIQFSLFESYGMACYEAAIHAAFLISRSVGDVELFSDPQQWFDPDKTAPTKLSEAISSWRNRPEQAQIVPKPWERVKRQVFAAMKDFGVW